MASSTSRATISFSIDLELEIGTRSDWLEERLSQSSTKLLTLLDRLEIAATWGVADPALSAAAEGILASKVPHQLAVLADRTWLGSCYPLAWQSAELARRFSRARQAGLHLRTLAMHNVIAPPAIKLFQEQGIEVVRLPSQIDWQSANSSMQLAGFSGSTLAIIPALSLPPRGSWWLPARWNVLRQLTHAIAHREFLHLTIDGQQLAALGDPLLRQIETILQQVAYLRTQDRVQLITLEEWLTTTQPIDKMASIAGSYEKAASISAAA